MEEIKKKPAPRKRCKICQDLRWKNISSDEKFMEHEIHTLVEKVIGRPVRIKPPVVICEHCVVALVHSNNLLERLKMAFPPVPASRRTSMPNRRKSVANLEDLRKMELDADFDATLNRNISEEEDDNEDEEDAAVVANNVANEPKLSSPVKSKVNGTIAKSAKKDVSFGASVFSDTDDNADVEPKPKNVDSNNALQALKDKLNAAISSSTSSFESDDDNQAAKINIKKPAHLTKSKAVSSKTINFDNSNSEDSEADINISKSVNNMRNAAATIKTKQNANSDSDSDDEPEIKSFITSPLLSKTAASLSISSGNNAMARKDFSSDESEDDDDEPDMPSKISILAPPAAALPKATPKKAEIKPKTPKAAAAKPKKIAKAEANNENANVGVAAGKKAAAKPKTPKAKKVVDAEIKQQEHKVLELETTPKVKQSPAKKAIKTPLPANNNSFTKTKDNDVATPKSQEIKTPKSTAKRKKTNSHTDDASFTEEKKPKVEAPMKQPEPAQNTSFGFSKFKDDLIKIEPPTPTKAAKAKKKSIQQQEAAEKLAAPSDSDNRHSDKAEKLYGCPYPTCSKRFSKASKVHAHLMKKHANEDD